ncbi:NAD(P)-dependent alcohol dehydrogenase [Marinicauda algicola]|uniref:alcohol dehydrogenase (NADP(+)) n=1 Tax=Marinicauda algicola TaxID=2029849 RepID=A0A4S2GYA2_9PROT|nr:NAD(P)-dependent alcohol dehydrogenase [Marinicauda algicola]TGY88145.1 NAD(P)-dependent alcohol dehydrogenase [Marinicauda algicola]
MIRAYAAKQPRGRFELIEYDPGPLKSDDIEIAVESCGLCHSDLSLLDDEWGMSEYPLVPGHEVVGTVTGVGREVTHLKPGDKVGVGWFSRSCLVCDQCMDGDHNMCPDAEQIAVGRYGGFADKVRVQASWANRLPDELDTRSAGPLFCGGITVFNPLVQFDVKPTDRVGVIGIGGLGHMALQFLSAWGCEVTAFTSTGAKADEARSFGAHRVVDSRDKDALKAEKGRYDFILSTVAVPLDWQRYFAALAPRGRLHTVGAVSEPFQVEAFTLIGGQKSLSGTPLGSPATIRKMLDFCARHGIAPQIEVMKMSEIDAAFDRLREGKPRYRIVLENDFR